MTLSKPYDFTAGTVIEDAQVDANFDSLFSAIGNQMFTEQNYVTNDQSVTASLDALDIRLKDLDLYGLIQRATFVYNGGATAYTVKVGAAVYYCKTKTCFWNSELTTSAIGTPVASTWYYLYLDYSAITSGTAITATELIWSSTAPAWNGTYRGWYNGDDRCIFAVRTNTAPDNVVEFFHDGGSCILYANRQDPTPLGYQPSDTWTDATLASYVPTFARRVDVTFLAVYGTKGATAMWRTRGATGTTGHSIAQVSAVFTHLLNSTRDDRVCERRASKPPRRDRRRQVDDGEGRGDSQESFGRRGD